MLEPPRWRYQTEIGGLSVFTNTLPRGSAWVEPAGSTSPLAPDSCRPLTATTRPSQAWQNPVTVVSTPRPAVLVRSDAYERAGRRR